MKFTRQDESQTVRFQISPAPSTALGDFHVRALVTSTTWGDGQTFDRGFDVIEYPHIRRQHIYEAADTTLKVLDVRTAPNLAVGYVMGSGDGVAPFIEQLGAKVETSASPDGRHGPVGGEARSGAQLPQQPVVGDAAGIGRYPVRRVEMVIPARPEVPVQAPRGDRQVGPPVLGRGRTP